MSHLRLNENELRKSAVALAFARTSLSSGSSKRFHGLRLKFLELVAMPVPAKAALGVEGKREKQLGAIGRYECSWPYDERHEGHRSPNGTSMLGLATRVPSDRNRKKSLPRAAPSNGPRRHGIAVETAQGSLGQCSLRVWSF